MPKCSYIKRRKRKLCIGDMDTYVTVQMRSISVPTLGDVDFGETFSNKFQDWALVEMVNGETFFDSTGIEQDVTHKIYMRFVSGVTAEDWVFLDSERYDVLDVENLDRRSIFMLLRCTNRGSTEASKA